MNSKITSTLRIDETLHTNNKEVQTNCEHNANMTHENLITPITGITGNTTTTIYNKSLILEDFVPESRIIIQDFKCHLCEGVYMNPVVDNCGHVFCRACITLYIQIEKKCPISNWSLHDNLITNLSIVQEILDKQLLRCKNFDKHCTWVGRLSQLTNHINVDCTRQIIKCVFNNCGQVIFREDLPNHLLTCDFRIINCIDCAVEIPFNQINMHQENCPRFKLICPQACGVLVERTDICSHIRDACVNTTVDCPYLSIGCSTRISKKELNDYISKNTNRHNLMMIAHIKTFSSEILNRFNAFDDKFQQIQANEEMVKDLQSTVAKTLKRKALGDNNSTTHNATENASNNEEAEDKLIIRKKRRNDEDDPFNLNKPVDINITSIKTADETISTSTDAFNGFDAVNISKGINVVNNKVICIDNGRTEHRYVFANIDLNNSAVNTEVEWKCIVNINSNWLAVGVCIKECVISNNYRFVSGNTSFNNSTFVISTNGFSWNCNNTNESNCSIINFPNIPKGETFCISLKYNSLLKELYYSIPNKISGKLTDVRGNMKNETLVPCVVMLNPGDEVTFEY